MQDLSFTLRPYQNKAVTAGLDYIDGWSKKPSLIVAPVGSGKSLLIADIADQVPGEPIIVLQPSKELLKQNYNKYISYGNEASIFSASLGKKDIGHVTYATPKSIISAADFIREKLKAKIVMIDEAHYHTKKDSTVKTFLDKINADKVIGFTATPIESRTYNGQGYLAMTTRSKNNLFKDIIHVTQISEVKNYWTKMFYEQRYVDTSILKLNSAGTDYTDASLGEFYTFNRLKEKVVQEVADMRADGRKSILVFVPSINEAIKLADLIPGAEAVHSKMDTKDRARIIEGFKNLEIPVVINVNILSIGFDHPELDGIITARPTNSFAVHYQQLGRGVRFHVNKNSCLVVDLSGNLATFGVLEDIEFKRGARGWGMFIKGEQFTSGAVFDTFEKRIKDNVDIGDWDGRIWFGKKFKDTHVNNLPTFYLTWLVNDYKVQNEKDELLLALAKEVLDKRSPIKTFKLKPL